MLPAVWTAFFVIAVGRGHELLESVLVATTIFGVFIVLITQLSSAVTAFTSGYVFSLWALVLVGTSVRWRKDLQAGVGILTSRPSCFRSKSEFVFALISALFLVGTFLAAVLYPSTNWDSMTCHMTRVFFWIQNGTTALYPSPVSTQNFTSPFAAWAIANVKILTGADTFVNLVQWLSYAVSALAIYAITGLLGSGQRGQRVAFICALSVPMAALQSSSTQYDMVTAIHVLISIYVMLRLNVGDSGRERISKNLAACWIGASIGLTALSKPTGLIAVLPFVIWTIYALSKKADLKQFARVVATSLLVMLIVVSGWWGRNAFLLQGDIMGSSQPGNAHILNVDRSVGALCTSVIRNLSQCVGTPVARVNGLIESANKALVASYGEDIDSAVNKENPDQPYVIPVAGRIHDIAPSPFTFLLIMFGAALAIADRRTRGIALPYLTCGIFALVVPAALITWNIYISRVLMPATLVLVPLIGLGYDALVGNGERSGIRLPRFVFLFLITAGILLAGGGVAFSSTNPLLPNSILPGRHSREVNGFWNTPKQELMSTLHVPEYNGFVDQVAEYVEQNRVQRLGIQSFENTNLYLYPLLARLDDVDVRFVGYSVLDVGSVDPSDRQAVLVFSESTRDDEVLGLKPCHTAKREFSVYLPRLEVHATMYVIETL